MRVAMVVQNPCVHDSRVQREAASLAAAGLEVTVLAATAPGLPLRERGAGYAIERFGAVSPPRSAGAAPRPGPLRELLRAQPALHALVTRARTAPARLRFALEVKHRLLALAPAVVHSHDLDTLGAAASAAAEVGARLVYDSHELWTEQDSPLPEPARTLERQAYRALEQRLIRRADAVITVSSGCADWLAQRYGIAPPELVLNAPSLRDLGEGGDLKAATGARGLLLLYVGMITRNRGLEEAIGALGEPELEACELVLLGPDMNESAARLRAIARARGVAERLHIRPPVPRAELIGWARSADVGLVLMVPAGESNRLCLPNKLFECAFAGLPIVASDLPVLGQWVREHQLGVTVADGRPSTIARAVRAVLDGRAGRPDAERRAAFVAAHAWERQAERLLAIYRRLGAPA